MMKKTAIDLNCDMGESFGRYNLGLDEEVIKLISSANVACGFHAGDPHVMRKTVTLAKENKVRVGAHPGLPDLLGFGRRAMKVSAEELKDFFVYQIGALKVFVASAGMRLQHVKMHGALDMMARDDKSLAVAMCEAAKEVSPELLWLYPESDYMIDIAESVGLTYIKEFYADRAYTAEKTLVSRKLPGAVIHDPKQIAERIIQFVETATVTTIDDQTLNMESDSICVHGDSPGALEIVRTIAGTLKDRNIAIKPMSELV